MRRLWLVPSEQEFKGLGFHLDNPPEIAPFKGCRYGLDIVSVSGIGGAAAVTAATLIPMLKPEHIILMGIAGASQTGGPRITDVVEAKSDTFVDLGFSQNGAYINLDRIGLPLLPLVSENIGCRFSCVPIDPDLPQFHFGTVNAITQAEDLIANLGAEYGIMCETMEGAGVALACQVNAIAFSHVRAISNHLGPRRISEWKILPALECLKAWFLSVQ